MRPAPSHSRLASRPRAGQAGHLWIAVASWLLAALTALTAVGAPAAAPARTNPPPPAAPPPPAGSIRIPSLFGNNLVLRRSQIRDERTTFTVGTTGIDDLDARTTTLRSRPGPSLRIEPQGDKKSDPVQWLLSFEELTPQDPFHLELRGRIRKPAPRAPKEVSLTLSNVTVGEVWLWDLGSGQSSPLPASQQQAILKTLRDEAVVLRLIDARPQRPRTPASAESQPSWDEVPPEQLVQGGYPTFLPIFVEELTRAVRSPWYNRPGDKGRPLAIGLILVDPATVPAGGRSGDPRQEKGRLAVKAVNDRVRAASRDFPGYAEAEVRELKREGRLPPPAPTPDLLVDSEVTSGPFRGFPYEDASGMIWIQPPRR